MTSATPMSTRRMATTAKGPTGCGPVTGSAPPPDPPPPAAPPPAVTTGVVSATVVVDVHGSGTWAQARRNPDGALDAGDAPNVDGELVVEDEVVAADSVDDAIVVDDVVVDDVLADGEVVDDVLDGDVVVDEVVVDAHGSVGAVVVDVGDVVVVPPATVTVMLAVVCTPKLSVTRYGTGVDGPVNPGAGVKVIAPVTGSTTYVPSALVSVVTGLPASMRTTVVRSSVPPVGGASLANGSNVTGAFGSVTTSSSLATAPGTTE